MPKADSQNIMATARAWLGTPWSHQGRLKDVGVDCGGLIIGVGKEFGLLDFDTQAYGLPDDDRRNLAYTMVLYPPRRLAASHAPKIAPHAG